MRNSLRSRSSRLVAAVVAGSLLLAACGDDSDDDDDASSETTEETTTTAGEDGGDEGGDIDADDDPVIDGSMELDDFLAVLADVDEFCGLDDASDVAGAALFMGETPEEREEGAQLYLAWAERARQLAPGEIEDDVNLVLDGLSEIIDALAEFDYDFVAVSDAAEAGDERALLILEGMEGGELTAASDRVDAWIEGNCETSDD